jgi:hypothetical protein
MAPNLFILGAARCGTSSLHSILGQHPDIHASKIKEPSFFVGGFQSVRNPIAYFKLFDSPKPYRMESSVAYLPCAETAPVLRDLFPTARFIVSLRHPKARAYALYRHMRHFGLEDIASFSEALKAEADRQQSKEFSWTCGWDVSAFLYCHSSFYDEQLTRYFSLFDRKQFYILSLAELSKEPVATTEHILEFLQVDPASARQFDFKVMNRWESNYEPYDSKSDDLMSLQFEGLTERTDRIVGRAIDWSV